MDQFVEQLLRDKGVPDDLDVEVRARLHAELADKASQMVNIALARSLPEGKSEQLALMLETDEPDISAIQKYVSDNVPDHDMIASAALLQFRLLFMRNS